MMELIPHVWLKSQKRGILRQMKQLEAQLLPQTREVIQQINNNVCELQKFPLNLIQDSLLWPFLIRNIQEEKFWETHVRFQQNFNKVAMVIKIFENHVEKAACIFGRLRSSLLWAPHPRRVS